MQSQAGALSGQCHAHQTLRPVLRLPNFLSDTWPAHGSSSLLVISYRPGSSVRQLAQPMSLDCSVCLHTEWRLLGRHCTPPQASSHTVSTDRVAKPARPVISWCTLHISLSDLSSLDALSISLYETCYLLMHSQVSQFSIRPIHSWCTLRPVLRPPNFLANTWPAHGSSRLLVIDTASSSLLHIDLEWHKTMDLILCMQALLLMWYIYTMKYRPVNDSNICWSRSIVF